MKSWVSSDPSLKLGDLVFSSYHKGEVLYRVTEITQRFLEKWDVDSHKSVFPGCQIGDEYNPMVTIEAYIDLSIKTDPKKKLRKSVKSLDASWVFKATPEHIAAHIQRLNDLLTTQYP